MAAKETFLPKEPLDLPKPKESEGDDFFGSHEVRTLLAWHAPGRPFRKRRKSYYINSLLIALLIEIILFLFSQYLLMLVVLSFVFVAFALVTVPPHKLYYQLSTEGVRIEDHFYLWDELYDFYFKKRDAVEILHVRTRAFIPGELTILLGDVDREHIKSVMLPYLPYREVVRQTFVEKSADWLSRNFPLEKPSS